MNIQSKNEKKKNNNITKYDDPLLLHDIQFRRNIFSNQSFRKIKTKLNKRKQC